MAVSDYEKKLANKLQCAVNAYEESTRYIYAHFKEVSAEDVRGAHREMTAYLYRIDELGMVRTWPRRLIVIVYIYILDCINLT